MAPIISIDLWCDPRNGKTYVAEFLTEFGPSRHISILRSIRDIYLGAELESKIARGSIESIEGYPGLYVLILKKKFGAVHLLGGLDKGRIVLVHGVKKVRFKPIHPSHYETALQRIKHLSYGH